MEIKFDFEVDERFQYSLNEHSMYLLDSIRIVMELYIKSRSNEIDRYNGGIIIFTMSPYIKALNNIEAKYNYNAEFPAELLEWIYEQINKNNVSKKFHGFVVNLD